MLVTNVILGQLLNTIPEIYNVLMTRQKCLPPKIVSLERSLNQKDVIWDTYIFMAINMILLSKMWHFFYLSVNTYL